MARKPTPPRQTDPRAFVAAGLSFVFPGLGQAYNGETAIAWILAAPVILLAVLTVLLLSLASGGLLAHLLDIRFLVGLIVLDAVLLAWRVVAIVQAYARRQLPGVRRWTTYALAGVLVVTLAMHIVPAYYGLIAINTLTSVSGGGTQTHDSFGGVGIDLPTPSVIPNPTQDRINILLAGIDWKPGRGEHLTDTLLVVSLDPTSGRTAMISVPRDLYGLHLPDGRVFNAKINSLLITATSNPKAYPLGGVGTLKATIGGLLGIRIDYFASINLLGFKQAVDSIGGVDITVERAINDPTYWDEYDHHTGFYLPAGPRHLDGHTALGFVRSRKGAGDNDFTRAARQQQVLTAIRTKLTAGNLLTALPGLMDAVRNTISTDVPSDQIPLLAEAVQNADLANVQRAVIQPPLARSVFPGPGGAYILVPDFAAILALGQRLMGDGAAAAATSTPTASP